MRKVKIRVETVTEFEINIGRNGRAVGNTLTFETYIYSGQVEERLCSAYGSVPENNYTIRSILENAGVNQLIMEAPVLLENVPEELRKGLDGTYVYKCDVCEKYHKTTTEIINCEDNSA